MKSGLAWGSFLCIICLYWRHFGGGDGGYLDLAVGAGAGVRVGQASMASIGSSSDGQDEAVDTPTMAVGRLGAKIGRDIIPF